MPHENLTPRPHSTPGPCPARGGEKQIPGNHAMKNDFLKCTKTENSRRRHENWGLNKGSLGFVLLAFSSLLSPPAFGEVGAPVSISGPGGTGTTPGTGADGDNLNMILTYTSVDYIDVTVLVGSPGPVLVNFQAGSGPVTNDTGQTWTSFTLELPQNDAGASFVSDAWLDNSGAFTTVVTGPDSVTFSGGSVPPNSSFDPIGEMMVTENFTIVETPYVVPEPSTGGLLLFGLLGAASGRRRRPRVA